MIVHKPAVLKWDNTCSTSDANGGAVMRRTRALKYIIGGARPNYPAVSTTTNTNEEDDPMATVVKQIATNTNKTEAEVIAARSLLVGFANTTVEDWERTGAQNLNMGLATTERDVSGMVEYGELGTILQRFKDKYCK